MGQLPKVMGLVAVAASAVALVGLAGESPAQSQPARQTVEANCNTAAMTAAVAGLGHGVVVKEVPNGPRLSGGTQYVAATEKVPAYCRVTGSYVTNPKTGKTANFIATFPERWNGKYLQLGCSGSCGFLLMNDPASPPIAVTAQGYPGQLIQKGYATFGNDLGHVQKTPAIEAGWELDAEGNPDVDKLTDYMYRADLVMADMGKAFTRALYTQAGQGRPIARSYFSGCSQGGREALIAATRFPEKFDGIIAGSPAADLPGLLMQMPGNLLAAQRPGIAKLSPAQATLVRDRIYGSCDKADGVADRLIQNPAACNFNPLRDLPICKAGASADMCVSQQQAESISVATSALVNERGVALQPGLPISDPTFNYLNPIPASLQVEQSVRMFLGKDYSGPLLRVGAVRPGTYNIIATDAAYRRFAEFWRQGNVLPEDFTRFMRNRGKLLWYHNGSDQTLTPYMSINRYKRLAQIHGGYARLQNNIRLFHVPGTDHCGMGGEGAGSFDAITAIEDWVEKGAAPNALLARKLDPVLNNIVMGKIDWSVKPLRTIPLCVYPQMARYSGRGDVNDAQNWECRAGDTRMLAVGESGRRAGVTP